MRILPFPTKNARKPAPQIADWSQQEIADFYRAHRLLAENGAAIGIDRGLSDIGEPWLVFFDQSSQDVFLHVARIDDRCHLICDPLNLRISAANIAALIMEFEAAVRTSLSIRSERAKNVVIHPAARIIMSISAIFLLFKLENSEAQAKGLADKVSVTGDATGPARLIDKSSAAFARAQNAFARAFDSVDAPANAALLAGVILAGELAMTLDANTKVLATETEKTVVLPHAEDAPALQLLEGSEQHKMLVPQTETAVHVQSSARTQPVTEVLQAAKNNGETAHALTQPQQVILKEAAPVLNNPVVEQHSNLHTEVSNQDVVIKSSEPMARTAEPEAESAPVTSSNGLKALTEEPIKTGGILFNYKPTSSTTPAKEAAPEAAKPAPEPIIPVSISTLDQLTSKAGFALKTSFDIVKSHALQDYLTKQMGGEFTFEYQTSGKLLIEQVGIENIKTSEIGIWTNVISDQSSVSVVGKASIIDDALTFFN
ncbi:hypothetical protein ASD54_23100 [Rhizobium sp. Root149]|uniref:hypothetical protein n=1 Tax=Rhizobium sp. Root149 TaxID=1736473 RepID=UPI000713A923|nr:hypothetical protein [Rhizobium sp. Root149]KQZ60481.1 hypothetical protein ASD54_23100 [Rhizobium sp. Root149]